MFLCSRCVPPEFSPGHEQDQHERAWNCVSEYMSNTLRLFPGKAADAVSTVMPELNGWLDESVSDIVECCDPSDHGVILWVNLPCAGILSVQKQEWVLSYVTNTLHKYKHNSMAIIVHANRAAQMNSGTGLQ